MPKDIRIRKGLDIKLVGRAEQIITKPPLGDVFAVKPSDFHGVVPKMLVKQGSEVKVGEAIFYDKKDERILFCSPVSGTIDNIVRGERRKILRIEIRANSKQEFKDFGKKNVADFSAEQIKTHLLSSGCWTFIKQRPYDVIAEPDKEPKAIFISAYATTPLAPDYDFILKDKTAQLQTAIDVLTKLTQGKVHVSVEKNSTSPFKDLKGIELHHLSGPHPVGNVSTQISKTDPINKGELVWVISPQDLVAIGELFLTGKFDTKRVIALTGSKFSNPHYEIGYPGMSISSLVNENLKPDNTRIISGDVLSGEQVTQDGFLGYYHQQITAIPEGNDYEFFGWNKPVFNKISPSRALTFSWLFPKKTYDLNTNTNGEHRAFVLTGFYERVFPLPIFPMQLLKSCMYEDLDEMEALGIYEVAPEDFALTEFICVSKQPHQQIIRRGLDLVKKELG